jgi:hypothetical protein
MYFCLFFVLLAKLTTCARTWTKSLFQPLWVGNSDLTSLLPRQWRQILLPILCSLSHFLVGHFIIVLLQSMSSWADSTRFALFMSVLCLKWNGKATCKDNDLSAIGNLCTLWRIRKCLQQNHCWCLSPPPPPVAVICSRMSVCRRFFPIFTRYPFTPGWSEESGVK